ncbi:MAG: prepilin-type N-terminal cleavage/methylation domain-containing protein [Oscillatoriales cyanobacterium]|nr:MAG: prepilin-type N-terminal cleavage/methylation domain-containing protein [Oscillatoriales cyanobacterium]TAH25962.1 MAG: prepilin-type N-terminal cleavage/methylation domain-containing protein [Oscillatoriales cyanobacterium]
MKIPILLKLLQSCHTKATPNFPNTRSRKGDQGFTLLELIVTVLVLGILSSIAAPSWLAFINNQRVRTVNDRVLQSLRSAQSEAKRTKRDIIITFSATPVDPPTATIDTIPPSLNLSGQPQPLRVETFNAGGEIKSGTIALLTNAATTPVDTGVPANSIVFDYQGNVKKLPTDTSDSTKSKAFVVTVSPVFGGVVGGPKKCVFVETILGGMRTAEGKDPATGCP